MKFKLLSHRAVLTRILYFFILFFLTLAITPSLRAQTLQSPESFLGYPIGTKYTSHVKLVEYVKYLGANSSVIKIQEYGKTYEGRPLLVAFISSAANLSRLEEIRQNNIGLTGIKGTKAGSVSEKTPVIVWLSYNVHGNEPSSSEAAMSTLYELTSKSNQEYRKILENTVIILDPCLNPDGRERYINFYNGASGSNPDNELGSREHREPWPGGRLNHYFFDLNRDWAWQTQLETQERLKLYTAWLPEVHVDFHEMGINDSYYFSPAGEPFHRIITPWQREYQELVGKQIAKSFEKNGWLYFNREEFDLLYPSYGDTYPTYNGSIGMTYEQAGGPAGGLSVINKLGDTLSLTQRALHHFTASMSTIRTSSENSNKLLTEFQEYFKKSKSKPEGLYKSYILKFDSTNAFKKVALENYLYNNGIEFGSSSHSAQHPQHEQGYSYFSGKKEGFTIVDNDLIIGASQPKSRLLQSLMEPRTYLSDSVTYDITAWAIPYAWGIPCFASEKAISLKIRERVSKDSIQSNRISQESSPKVDSNYAYLMEWSGIPSVKALTILWKERLKVRFLAEPMTVSKHSFLEGTLVITKASNQNSKMNLSKLMDRIQNQLKIKIYPITSAFSKLSNGLASKKVHFLPKPSIGIVYSDEMDPSAFGELWAYFEEEIGFPAHQIPLHDLSPKILKTLTVLILPDIEEKTSLSEETLSALQTWISDGGKLIVLEGSVKVLVGKKGFNIKLRNPDSTAIALKKKDIPNEFAYRDRDRKGLRKTIIGAIFKAEVDNTNPLGYGYPNYYFTLKNKSQVYELFSREKGWNVGSFNKNAFTSGFAGDQVKKLNQNSLAFGWQDYGNGNVVYLTDDPLFRSFWLNGKLLFANAVFMVGN